ncbi:hypothetical protein CYMTET_29038, partial [Cymbomonas tetramitiformis]
IAVTRGRDTVATGQPALLNVAAGRGHGGKQNGRKPVVLVWSPKKLEELARLEHPPGYDGIGALTFSADGSSPEADSPRPTRSPSITCPTSCPTATSLAPCAGSPSPEPTRASPAPPDAARKRRPGRCESYHQPPSKGGGPAPRFVRNSPGRRAWRRRRLAPGDPAGCRRCGGPQLYALACLRLRVKRSGGALRARLGAGRRSARPGTKVVVVCTDDASTLFLWDWKKGKLLANVLGRKGLHKAEVLGVRWNPFATASDFATYGYGHIKFWRCAVKSKDVCEVVGKPGRFGQIPKHDVLSAVYLPSGLVVGGCETGDLCIWQPSATEGGVAVRLVKAHDKGPEIKRPIAPPPTTFGGVRALRLRDDQRMMLSGVRTATSLPGT